MMRIGFRFLVAFGLGLALAPTVSIAQTPPAPSASRSEPSPELAKVLALPVSTGSIALLVEHVESPDAQQRLRDALKDPRPEVRTVAARVIFADGVRPLIPDLRIALKAEQDSRAGAEEIRAIMTFVPAYKECVDAAIRLRGPALYAAIETFARINSSEILTHLPQLAAAKPGESLASALVVISNGNPSMRDRVLRDAASDPSTLDATLAATLEAGGHAPADLLVSLLKSDNQDLRMVTAWHLARVVANGDAAALTPEINAALDPLFASNASRVTWEALGLELLARAAHQKKHERHWTELKEESAGEMARWRPGADGKLLALMSDDERDDLTDALYGKRDLWRRSSRLAPTFGGPVIGPPATEQPKDLGVRTVPPFTKGLWQDVLSLEQCDAKPRRMVVAEVAYFPDGRIQRLYVGKTDAGDACVRAAQVLLRLTMSFGAKPASKEDVLVLPLVPEHITCADDEPAWGVEGEAPARIGRIHGQTIAQPKKIQDLKPVYPEPAQKQRLQGPVLMDAVISRTGCVANATVKSSPAPMLSGAALFAVMGWRYTPTLIDDKPVPVMMTVTVNFTLSP